MIKLGLSSILKPSAAIRLLSYGLSAHSFDEYVCIVEITLHKCMTLFPASVCDVLGEEYLFHPNVQDVQSLLQVKET